MIHLANILIAADDAILAQGLVQQIRRHGYEGHAAHNLDAALVAARRERPDLILIEASADGAAALALAEQLKAAPECAEIPVCLLASERSPALKARAFAAGLDDVLSPPLDENKLVARLRPLARLAIMHAELHRRAAVARRFGVAIDETLPPTEVDAGCPILVVGCGGPEIAGALSGRNVSLAADPFEANELLERDNFDAAVVLPAEAPTAYLDLCAHIRNNPRLFNLPVLVVAEPERMDEATAYRHGASGFFLRPVDPAELQIAVNTLVRRQRRRWMIREALGRTLQPATRDAGTGLYNRPFVDAYLADRVAFCAAHARHLSVAFFRAPDIDGVRHHFGEEQAEHLRLQVAQWIAGLLRAEDLTARYEDNEFCVLLPDTPKEEAEIVMHRIAGVLAYTDFAVKDVYQPVKVWARVGAADLRPDDTVATLVARARRDIVS